MKNNTKVSIIMPCYNSANYIEETLDSVLKQTYEGEIEVLLLDDASTDNTVEVISKKISENRRTNIQILLKTDSENKGQGFRRNKGIKEATGEYVLFFDSDDLIHEDLIKTSIDNMLPTMDCMMFDWAFYYPEDNNTVYVNREQYLLQEELRGSECENLLTAQTYFTVNKLYKRVFLLNNNILFGEGYLYEDFEFYTLVAQTAKYIGILPNIFYKVRVHDESSTKSSITTLKHYESFLKAIEKSCQIMNFRKDLSTYNLYKYFVLRSLIYSVQRIPNKRGLRTRFIKETMKILNTYGGEYAVPEKIVPIFHYAFNKELVKKEKAKKLRFYYFLQEKKILYRYCNSLVVPFEKSIFYLPKRVLDKRKQRRLAAEKQLRNDKIEIVKGKILMLGFDRKYMGNSKYLFDYLKEHYSPEKLKFVTTDPSVDKAYRLSVTSESFDYELYSSEFVIGESWIPLKYKKKENQKWIQLWHGTPFKKLLFDSTELSVMMKSPAHKVNLKKDIERWDVLLSDSEAAIDKFSTSLDIDKKKIVNLGYPRNQWLLNNNNELNKRNIRQRLGIVEDKKIILYAPTWRDYNYKKNLVDFDTNYLLDTSKLSEYLGNDYQILFKGHDMEASILKNNKGTISLGEEIDTQELILLADIVITDYSSILFDAIHLDKPIYLFINDLSKYERVRGIYKDMLEDFQNYVANNEERLADLINRASKQDIPNKYKNNELIQANENIKNLIESFE